MSAMSPISKINGMPGMVVENNNQRTGKKWGIPAPDKDLTKELNEAMVLNSAAKKPGFPIEALAILKEYIPINVTDEDIVTAMQEVMGYNSWYECCEFVKDDRCSDFFDIALTYCIKQGQAVKRKEDFVDGSGIGFEVRYLKDLRPVLKKGFDAKYAFYEDEETKRERPLVHMWKNMGIDYTMVANDMHPGHPTYPAGHGIKFLQAVATLRKIYALDSFCDKNLFIAACVEAMARSGIFVHYTSDNLAGGFLTTLKEFKIA